MIFHTAFPRICFGIFWILFLLVGLWKIVVYIKDRKRFAEINKIGFFDRDRFYIQKRVNEVLGEFVEKYYRARNGGETAEEKQAHSQYREAAFLAERFSYQPLGFWEWERIFQRVKGGDKRC